MKKAIEVQNISKSYQNRYAVNHIDFEIESGKIFGLLGPNGSGKTTLIRMITGILIPDSGRVMIHGRETNLVNNAQFIGYMPEERGLYKKMKAEEQAIYLGQLKGLSYIEAKEKVNYWFSRLEMNDWRNKKVEEVSKGMAQKLQFVCTVLHEPSIIILDEPFSGLDPLNADIIKNEISNLARQGATIVFSTHRMEQVEEICEHILLINNGLKLLDDTVQNAKNQFKLNKYILKGHNLLALQEQNNIFQILERQQDSVSLKLNENVSTNDVLREVIGQNIQVHHFSEELPSLHQIFIELVNNQ